MQATFDNVIGSAEVQLDVLKAICGNTFGKSMIDVGCGFAPQTRLLGFKEKYYIDIVKRDLAEENIHFYHRDILEVSQSKTDWMFADVSISLDNLEHFWEEDGKRVVKWMQDSSYKQVVFTPNGRYMNVDDKTNNDPDTHKHSWTDRDFQQMGWATITFPRFHPTLGEGGLGAFFAFNCEDLHSEFQRTINELKSKSWAR